MKIAIVGGKLQGTEAVYLAKEASYYSILIDSNPNVMASKICDEFVCGDVINEDKNVVDALIKADIILPAMENLDVIKAIYRIADKYNILVAFDLDAYMITLSKIKSDKMFLENGINAPKYYPNCDPPYIIKPVSESGSHGVTKIDTEKELIAFKKARGNEKLIIQEYLEGPSYSVEIIGNGDVYRTYAITKIHMDNVFDCCQVTAPTILTMEEEFKFSEIAIRIAKIINLKGIMDVEVIYAKGEFKVLEIDARIPSQTPAVVLKSSGMNLLKELVELKVRGRFITNQINKRAYATYENYKMGDGNLVKEGEHIMAGSRPLKIEENQFGYETIIWDYAKGKDFSGIFINSEKNKDDLISSSLRLSKELAKLL